MANIRNFKEYRKELLSALGIERGLADVNDKEFKGDILTALGVEYTASDIANFETYRNKLIEGLQNGGGGGGIGTATEDVGVVEAGDYVLEYDSELDIYRLNPVLLDDTFYGNKSKVVYFDDGVNPPVTGYGFTSGDYDVTLTAVAVIDDGVYAGLTVDASGMSEKPSTITVTVPHDIQCYVATNELIDLFPNGRLYNVIS